jgi:hypothetical protein
MLLRQDGTKPGADEAAACFFTALSGDMPPQESTAFASEAVMLFERVGESARAGDEIPREWRSHLYTAVSGQLLSALQVASNLAARNWNDLLRELCSRPRGTLGDSNVR